MNRGGEPGLPGAGHLADGSAAGLASPARGSRQQIARLLGGNFASDFLLAVTLWAVCRAYGVDLPLATLLAIHLGVSLINGFVPVPGGIGIWETLLSTGLIAAGVSEVDALAIAITWRVLTFYLPPIWGAYSMRWLARHGYI